MKIMIDTSIIVEVDRGNKAIVEMLKKLVDMEEEIFISTITVSEILTGTYLRTDFKEASLKAKEILNQFIWVNIDGETAEITAELWAHIIAERRVEEIEYQDVLIAASCLSKRCDLLITKNKKDFYLLPTIKNFIQTPEEFIEQHL